MYNYIVCTAMWLSCDFYFVAADVTIPMTTPTPSTSTSTPTPKPLVLLGIDFHAHMYVHTVQRCNMQF